MTSANSPSPCLQVFEFADPPPPPTHPRVLKLFISANTHTSIIDEGTDFDLKLILPHDDFMYSVHSFDLIVHHGPEEAPTIYGYPTYNNDNKSELNIPSFSSSSSCSSSSSSSSSLSSSPAPETSELGTKFNVTLPPLPLFTFVTINTWLLLPWTFPPDS